MKKTYKLKESRKFWPKKIMIIMDCWGNSVQSRKKRLGPLRDNLRNGRNLSRLCKREESLWKRKPVYRASTNFSRLPCGRHIGIHFLLVIKSRRIIERQTWRTLNTTDHQIYGTSRFTNSMRPCTSLWRSLVSTSTLLKLKMPHAASY